jgi:DNA-binding NarL/FixJ family response regulator
VTLSSNLSGNLSTNIMTRRKLDRHYVVKANDRSAGGAIATGCKAIHALLVEADVRTAKAIAEDLSRNSVRVTAVGTLSDAKVFLRHSEIQIDVVILALRLPDGRGESLLRDIEALSRQPAVVITSAFLSELREDALEYRPVMVPKPVNTCALLRIVRTVASGYTRPIINRFITAYDLSRREKEALVLVSQGLKAKEVAVRMRCSEPTAYGHLARACTKIGCTDYHGILARLFAFACQAVGHTPPDHKAFTDHIAR